MNIMDMVNNVHENAVNHGWWETERPMAETLSLIISEWSEALEEYRAGRPMVWHACKNDARNEDVIPCEQCPDCHFKKYECKAIDPKPEGIAVELIDGVIRIFDLIGAMKVRVRSDVTIATIPQQFNKSFRSKIAAYSVPELCFALSSATCKANDTNRECATSALMSAVAYVVIWLGENGVDVEKTLMDKHEYNKNRPYRHGGKKC